jgi:hypothetical protein
VITQEYWTDPPGKGAIMPDNPASSQVSEEPWFTPCGDWRANVWDLIRWLFANNCSEYAYELERQAQSVSPSAHPEAEIEALAAMLSPLDYIDVSPPRHLTAQKYKELKYLRRNARRAVIYCKRQLASKEVTKANAAKNLKDRMDELRHNAIGVSSISEFDERGKQWCEKGPLGMELDTNSHTVQRKGKSIKFGSNGRPWEVFVRLAVRHPGMYMVKDLGHDVWNSDGKDIDPDDNLVQQTITTIRNLLRPLQIAVQHTRKLGYLLVDETGSPIKPKNRGKRKSPRARKP